MRTNFDVRIYILLLLASGTGFAGTLTTSVYGAIGLNGPVGIPTLTCSQSGSASAACSAASGQDSLSLQANADFGNLSGTVMGSSADTNFFEIDAMSGFTDTLTINAAGTPSGFVEYLFKLTGQRLQFRLRYYRQRHPRQQQYRSFLAVLLRKRQRITHQPELRHVHGSVRLGCPVHSRRYR